MSQRITRRESSDLRNKSARKTHAKANTVVVTDNTTFFSRLIRKLNGQPVNQYRSQSNFNHLVRTKSARMPRIKSPKENRIITLGNHTSTSQDLDIDLGDLNEDEYKTQHEEEQQAVTPLWIEIESKQLTKIATFWTIVSIVIQLTVLFMIVYISFDSKLIIFNDGSTLTPFLYKGKNQEFYAKFFTADNNTEFCKENIRNNPINQEKFTCICDAISSFPQFFVNTCLVFTSIECFVFTIIGLIAKAYILRGHYFKYTNLLLLHESLNFIIMPLCVAIFELVFNNISTVCFKGFGSYLWMAPLMGFLLLIYYVWGRYYANQLQFAQTV